MPSIGGGTFARRYCQKGPGTGPLRACTPRTYNPEKRVLEIGSGAERIDSRVRKTLAQPPAEQSAELLAGHPAGGSLNILAGALEASRLGAAEPLHLEHDAIGGLFADAEDAPGEVTAIGPQVNQRALAFTAQLAVEGHKFREPFSVLVNFCEAGTRERRERGQALAIHS